MRFFKSLKGSTTFRVKGKAFTSIGGAQIGNTANALVAPFGSGSATLLLEQSVLHNYETVVAVLSAFDGGACKTDNLAVYTFRKNFDLPVKQVETLS